MAGVRPDLIASVTSVGAPPIPDVADLIRKVPEGSSGEAIIAGLVNAMGALINFLPAATAALRRMHSARSNRSTEGAARFNAKFPQGIPTTACGEGAYKAVCATTPGAGRAR